MTPLFFFNFRLYLFASEVYPLTRVSPCHCDQVRVTGHGLSSLIVKFLIFIFFFFFFFFFFQAWELFHITHFLKQHLFLSLFLIVLVTNLITLITCQHLPNLISGHCQKFFSQNFNFTLLGNYIWLLNFLFNHSCTTPQTNIVTLSLRSKPLSLSFWNQLEGFENRRFHQFIIGAIFR